MEATITYFEDAGVSLAPPGPPLNLLVAALHIIRPSAVDARIPALTMASQSSSSARVTDRREKHCRRRAPYREREAIMPKAASKRTVAEHTLFKTHDGHAQHLCDLVARRKMDRVATLSKGAKYVCHICGRAAAKAANLCEPVEI